MHNVAELSRKVNVPYLPTDVENAVISRINSDLRKLMRTDIHTVHVAEEVVLKMIQRSFLSPSKGRFFFLREDNSLVQYAEREAFKFMKMEFGEPFSAQDDAAFSEIANQKFPGNSQKDIEARREFVRSCHNTARNAIMDHIKLERQRDKTGLREDMFAQEPRIELLYDRAEIVLTHKPFHVECEIDDAIIENYKEHFPQYDEFLRFLVASRFAIDRKKSYLWLWADSDWGKGLLFDGVFGPQGLRCTVGMSVAQVEKIFDGSPAPLAPETFIGNLAVVFNEFKSIKSELKQLENSLPLAPKNRLCSHVEIYAKIFTSAESVNSLVTEAGVEDQFANRMSIIRLKGSIEDNPMWQKVGKPRYLASLRAHTAHFLNEQIADRIALGKIRAQEDSDAVLREFHKKYGIANTHGRMSDGLQEKADACAAWLIHMYGGASGTTPNNVYRTLDGVEVFVVKDGVRYLVNAATHVDRYIKLHITGPEATTILKRKDELMELMSADGKGIFKHRIGEYDGKRKEYKQRKSVQMKP